MARDRVVAARRRSPDDTAAPPGAAADGADPELAAALARDPNETLDSGLADLLGVPAAAFVPADGDEPAVASVGGAPAKEDEVLGATAASFVGD